MDREQFLIDTLDERLGIMSMTCSGPADKAYYDGMVKAAWILGYDVQVDDEGNHKLFKR